MELPRIVVWDTYVNNVECPKGRLFLALCGKFPGPPRSQSLWRNLRPDHKFHVKVTIEFLDAP